MRLRLTKQIFAAVAVLASLASVGTAQAQGDSFIVASQVVSDTALPADGGYIGDLASATISDGTYSEGCASGNCGGSCGDCASGSCGTCGDGSCGDCESSGGGLLGKLRDRRSQGDCPICEPRQYGNPDLFYNFYSGGDCNTANAQMYVSPVPVPQFVGHTFNTYQPLYPHEFMYRHTDRYHNVYDNGRGENRTRVHYSYPPVRTALSNLYWNKLRLPR